VVEREEEGATLLELTREETFELSFLPALCADLLVFFESCCVLCMVAVAVEVERVLLETEGVLFVEQRYREGTTFPFGLRGFLF
jgi:hypothetical protein